jgi:hypothetical protein
VPTATPVPSVPVSRFKTYYQERAAADPAWAEARRLHKRDQERAAYPEKREAVLLYQAQRRKAKIAEKAAAAAADPNPPPRNKGGRPRQQDAPLANTLARLIGANKPPQ